jgi:hypothetical protein
MGSIFDDSQYFAHTKAAAFNGLPQSGKTWMLEGICDAAGVDPKLALVECSTPIIDLAELFRQFLIKMMGWGLLRKEQTAIPIVLKEAHSWLRLIGDGLLPEIPIEAFMSPSVLQEGRADRIMRSIDEVWKNPETFGHPVSLDNKSTTHRHLLTAINLATSELACLWLDQNRKDLGGITNLWPFWAMKTLERRLMANPDMPFVGIGGFRMPNDGQILPVGAYYMRRIRPGAQLDQEHIAYESELHQPPVDYEIVGDCPREEPGHNDRLLAASQLWWLMNQADLLPPGQRDNVVLRTDDLVRKELERRVTA